MTGLDADNDKIIEIATIVTDSELNVLAEGPVFAISQSNETLAAMDDWNQEHHGKSGLIDRVKASTVTEAEAEQKTIEFLQQYVAAGKSPMCGNSVWQDRRFLCRYMPKLESFFHYRLIDVSTMKELAKRWAPRVYNAVEKEGKHQALDDVKDSIAELVHYREHFIKD